MADPEWHWAYPIVLRVNVCQWREARLSVQMQDRVYFGGRESGRTRLGGGWASLKSLLAAPIDLQSDRSL